MTEPTARGRSPDRAGDERLPEHLRPLFWDTDFDRLRVEGHERYVIERVLEYGDVPQVRWMMRRFPKEQIAETLRRTRRLSPKSAHFWASILDVPIEEIRCLSASFRRRHREIWPA
ncbi:MAG: hypothetical protein DRI48_05470 [Chloroflexi bacterium]|nr:MAG: hypothetical protein DRI48_05470 [Chloroflexota bacterium]